MCESVWCDKLEAGRDGVTIPTGAKFVGTPKTSGLAPGPTIRIFQWLSGVLSRGYCGLGMKLTTNVRLVPRLGHEIDHQCPSNAEAWT